MIKFISRRIDALRHHLNCGDLKEASGLKLPGYLDEDQIAELRRKVEQAYHNRLKPTSFRRRIFSCKLRN